MMKRDERPENRSEQGHFVRNREATKEITQSVILFSISSLQAHAETIKRCKEKQLTGDVSTPHVQIVASFAQVYSRLRI